MMRGFYRLGSKRKSQGKCGTAAVWSHSQVMKDTEKAEGLNAFVFTGKVYWLAFQASLCSRNVCGSVALNALLGMV